MDSQKIFKLIIVLSILGILVDGLLLYNKTTDSNVACEAGGGCDLVGGSIYSEIAGIPVSVFGIGAFFVFALIGAAGLKGKLEPGKAVLSILILSGLGLLGAAYFVYIMVFVLEAICQWCMVSHLFLAAVFVASVLAYRGRV